MKKIAIVILEGLPNWQAMNAASHLALSLGHYSENGIMGKHPVTDKSGVNHMGICKHPIVVLMGREQDAMRRLLAEARLMGCVTVADFPREMLDTYTDEEMAAAVSQRAESELEYLAIAILGPVDELKRLTKELKLWR